MSQLTTDTQMQEALNRVHRRIEDTELTLEVGRTTTGEAGSNAEVINTGTERDIILNFTIPRGDQGYDGDPGPEGESAYEVAVSQGFSGSESEWLESLKGDAATIEVGTVTTGEAGTEAEVTNVGTDTNAIFDFVIPKGDQGEDGVSPNILRGTNSCTELQSQGATNTWQDGEWTVHYDTYTPTLIEVSDAPDPNITIGWDVHSTSNNNVTRSVKQSGIPVREGQQYTISCYARGSDNCVAFYLQQSGTSSGGALNGTVKEDYGTWQLYSYTFTSNYDEIDVGFFGNTTSCEVCGMKLEEGSVATPWCPSYWDMENKNVDVPTKLSELENDAGYATTTQMESSIAELDILGNVGTSIPSESDLNDYTTAGKYYSQNSTVTSTLENCPFTGAGFALYVATNASQSYYLQILTASGTSAYGRGRYFIRFYNPSGSNNNWIEVASSDDIPTKTSDLTNDSGYTALSYDEGEKTIYF